MDWRWRRLPNPSVVLLAVLGILYVGCHPVMELRCLPAVFTLVLGLPLIALRACGAGDVKLFAALTFWLPERVGVFLVAMAIIGVLLSLLMMVQRRRTVPYGCAMLLPAILLLR